MISDRAFQRLVVRLLSLMVGIAWAILVQQLGGRAPIPLMARVRMMDKESEDFLKSITEEEKAS